MQPLFDTDYALRVLRTHPITVTELPLNCKPYLRKIPRI